MVGLVEFIARSLVDDPDSVVVTETEDRHSINIQLKVAPDDMGKIIGKGGKRAQAIRSIMKAKYSKTGKRVVVDIAE